GVTVRANYVALPFAAGRGEDEGGESRPDQDVKASVLTRKYGPLAQNPAMERRKAMRFRRFIVSQAVPEAKRYQGAPRGAPCPSLLREAKLKAHLARGARAITRG
ncbi:MAG: hypothetical protein Q7V17_08570, partial [Afipia sp.]|nr:hypothetical protein [Afipia sp.]